MRAGAPLRAPASLDGYFYYDADSYGGPLECLVDMARTGYASPAVAIVERAAPGRVAQLKRELEARAGPLALLDVGDLLCEADKTKIYGQPGEIRGGLTKFIDDHNNPNVTATPFLVVVVARVNAIGQFMLRELLEQGAFGRTHRLAVAKRSLLFLLDAADGHITPQAHSRAHYIERADDRPTTLMKA